MQKYVNVSLVGLLVAVLWGQLFILLESYLHYHCWTVALQSRDLSSNTDYCCLESDSNLASSPAQSVLFGFPCVENFRVSITMRSGSTWL